MTTTGDPRRLDDRLLEHYRVPETECASENGETLWRRHRKPLGRGAYGEVWLEENASEGKLRAVKTVRDPTTQRSHINAEVIALVNLSQRRYRPFFGEFLGFHEDAGCISFFMEYFPQRDLRQHLEDGTPLGEDEGRTIVRQILHGVAAMHDQRFTHRDLKPENIFVVTKNPWRIKIGDFGVAKRVRDEAAYLGTKVGTEQYMAPEVFLFVDDGRYSDSVDVWSSGVICFELLTGERPFPTHAKLKAYCDGRFPFPDASLVLNSVSREGSDFVHSLLYAQPAMRPRASDALKDAWFAAGLGLMMDQRSATTSPRLQDTSPRASYRGGPPARYPSDARSPPNRPLPAPPSQHLPVRTSSVRNKDEGYHTSSDRGADDCNMSIRSTSNPSEWRNEPPRSEPQFSQRSPRLQQQAYINQTHPLPESLAMWQPVYPRGHTPRTSPTPPSQRFDYPSSQQEYDPSKAEQQSVYGSSPRIPSTRTSPPIPSAYRQADASSPPLERPGRSDAYFQPQSEPEYPPQQPWTQAPRQSPLRPARPFEYIPPPPPPVPELDARRPGTGTRSPRLQESERTGTLSPYLQQQQQFHESDRASTLSPRLQQQPLHELERPGTQLSHTHSESLDSETLGMFPSVSMGRPPTAVDTVISRSMSRTMSRTASRSESGFSTSTSSSRAECRDWVQQKLRDGQWKVNDVIVLCQVSRWDLIRISAHLLASDKPITFTENLHKNYINELPKLIFDALKPYLLENLAGTALAKTLAKEGATWQQRIRDDILPYVDVLGAELDFFKLKLPSGKASEGLSGRANIVEGGGSIRVPAATVTGTIRDHWRLYIEEYINGFLYNDRAILKKHVRAIVFDEPAVDYALHEEFYKSRLIPKLKREGLEYTNCDGFRKYVSKSVKAEKKPPPVGTGKSGGGGWWKRK